MEQSNQSRLMLGTPKVVYQLKLHFVFHIRSHVKDCQCEGVGFMLEMCNESRLRSSCFALQVCCTLLKPASDRKSTFPTRP